MIERLQSHCGSGCDPYANLAVEQYLLETTGEGCCTLYLWQNRNTVVIGRNQNAWKECRASLLEAEGGTLARRLSGGGAVYHDLGNLNFTFLVPSADYDLDRQLRVIERALASLGIGTCRSGRNDLLADGRKFSGSAFYHSGGRSYHHGTLLVNVDTARMGRYLVPSREKLSAKGVDSVRARVVNLVELCPVITVERLKTALLSAFSEVYGLPVLPIEADLSQKDEVQTLRKHYADWEWNYGKKLPCDASFSRRFPWGEVQIELNTLGGVVTHAKVYSDAMDVSLAPALEAALSGCRLIKDALKDRVQSAAPSVPGLTDWINEWDL